jgi:hypothetical protein
MQTLTLKQFFRAMLVSLLIVGSIWALVMVFVLVLPSFSLVVVHKEDRVVIEELRHLATWTLIVTALLRAALGVCIPMAVRWGIKRRKERYEQKVAA